MKRLFIFIIFIVLIVILSGCKDTNPLQPPTSNGNIVPLAKGNMWTYTYAEYDSLGSAFVSVTETASVQGDSIFLGRSMTLLRFEDDSWYANTDSGLIQYNGGNNSPPTNTFGLKYQYPTAKGNSYGKTFISIVDVGSTDTLITVPAGTFHCVQYHFHEIGSPLMSDHFVSPGIGLIKTAVYNTYAPLRVSDGHQLLSYSLK